MQSIRVQMHTSSSEDLSRMSVASVSTLTGVSVCACVCVCVWMHILCMVLVNQYKTSCRDRRARLGKFSG